MAGEFGVLLVLLLGVGGSFLLYALVERESDDTEAMSRRDAEREVRRDR